MVGLPPSPMRRFPLLKPVSVLRPLDSDSFRVTCNEARSSFSSTKRKLHSKHDFRFSGPRTSLVFADKGGGGHTIELNLSSLV